MKRLFIIAGIALGLLSPALVQGQETGLLRLDKKHLTSRSDISLWGGVEDGRFRPASAAQTQLSVGTDARFVRHGRQTSWTGTISLEQMFGKYNGSSLFLEPDYYPIEFLDTSWGKGSRQTVRLEGGFLRDISDLWQAGLKGSFKGMHEAKRSALQHSSSGMEAQLEPVVTFISDDDACVVSSYLVRLRTENAKVDQPGDATPVFLDKGMLYGTYVPDLAVFPVMEFTHGFYEEYYSPTMSMGFGITWKRGRAGENDYSQYRFPGSTLKGFYEMVQECFDEDLTYRVSYQRERDQLREVPESGDTFNALSDRVGRNLDFKFGILPHKGALKSIGIDLGGNYWSERAVASPIFDRTKRVDASATLSAFLSKGSFDMDLSVLGGMGKWIDQGYAGTSEGTEELPFRLTDNWNRKMEYYLAPRIGMGGTLTYRLPSVKGMYLQFYGYWHRAFNISYLRGKNRAIATLTIGYTY